MNDSAESRPLTFGELGVPGPLVRVLAADDKKTAFPIQADTLPDSLAGRDILGRGRTGSGKTLAFSIPLVTRLGSYDSFGEIAMEEFRKEIKRRKKASLEERRADDFLPHPRGLVLAPTRELANQINDVLMPLAHTFGMNTTTVYGGVKYIHQIRDLKAGADIVVACPGRLEDLLRQQALTLSSVEVVVIDEADEMADMGFLPPVKRLLEQISPDAQHMLFSATLDHGVDEVVNTFLHDPKVHEVDSATAEPDLMTHHVFETTRGDKHELVRMLASGEGRRILFTRTKFQAKKLAKNLTQNGIPAAELHGNLNQNQRDRNLAAFDSGDVRVMVATDVAARGIDVGGVELVVQVEPPADPKSFVHRSGRTARAGKAGDVVTLVLPEQRRETRRLLNQAGIKTKMIEVTHDSPEVLELVGDRAERVDGWSLDKSQPVGNPRKGKNRGAKKPYLIFSLCDETFAIDNGTIIAADVDRGWFYFFVGLLNQSSWVAGATLGGLLGERITFNTSGLDFIMTAMFAVIFVDQWLTTKRKSHMAALTGIAVPAICLGVFGADNFMIPSLVAMLVMFILLRPYLDDLKIDKTDGENETNNADKETNA